MPLVCVQCAMRALLNDTKVVPVFEQTFEEHMAQYHSDPYQTYIERRGLERELASKLWADAPDGAAPRRRVGDWNKHDSDDGKSKK